MAENSQKVAHANEMVAKLEQLFTAASEGDAKAFRRILKQDFKEVKDLQALTDGRKRTLLHHAASNGRDNICVHLIEDLEFDINRQDVSGETPLAYASSRGNITTMKLLLDNGAKSSLRAPTGAGPIHRAAASGRPEAVELLAAAGANVNQGSETGSPLCWASGSGQAACVRALLRLGADVALASQNKVAPLLLAAAAGCPETVELLLEKGADVGQVNMGNATALHAAAACHQDEEAAAKIVAMLLKAGADANVVDAEQRLPLVCAAALKHTQVVELLLPATQRLEGVEWSVEGVVAHAQELLQAARAGQAGSSAPVEVSEEARAQASAAKREGDKAFVAQQWKDAEQHYTAAVQLDPNSHVAWANRAAARLRLQDFKGAVEDARRSSSIDKAYVKAWYREACGYMGLEDWEAAAGSLYEGLAHDPENSEMLRLFKVCIENGQKVFKAKQAEQQRAMAEAVAAAEAAAAAAGAAR